MLQRGIYFYGEPQAKKMAFPPSIEKNGSNYFRSLPTFAKRCFGGYNPLHQQITVAKICHTSNRYQR